jgi:uncharacterized protein (TIGR03435 family)
MPRLAFVLLSCACLLDGQPTFEAASVKPNRSGSPASLVRPSPGRFEAENQTLEHLVMLAYDVKDFQVSGGPGWIRSERYDIDARAKGNPSREEMLPMLQALLADRFHLMLRREMKQLPVYELAVAKTGFKAQPVDCFTLDPNSRTAPPQGQAVCGGMGWGKGSIDSAATNSAFLTAALATILGRTVIDKTGVTGWFAVHLKFVPPNLGSDDASADTGLPSVFTALQEQVGLKLDSARGPVEVLTVESVDKPSGN